MEPKPSASAAAPQPPQAGAPAEGSRRRGTAGKRKAAAAAAAAAAASFNPSKRQAKERNPFHMPPPLHNGPLTRAARHSPHKLSVPQAEVAAPTPQGAGAAAGGGGGRVGGIPAAGDVIRLDDEESPSEEPPVLDAEFEAVRSRGAGVHVVPNFAGWFAWKEIHPIEKQMLPSFFSGKSEKRTPEIYMSLRNFIMRKFHADPQVKLEAKDLGEIPIGETESRQEILEFLDHWGLINFHPFLPAGTEERKSDADIDKKTSLVEKLFQFETVQSYLVPVPKKAEGTAPALVPSLFPEPALPEDFVTAVEPSVEYHCNSCSADCSRKRYHCQTQADFDLCADCYNEGKFDTGMARADFILMESAGIPGAGGTSWTDQETLLLLEALELFGANWSEIAEHVATKSKAQCMQHFLQMPIEESFLDGEDANQAKAMQETTELALTEKNNSNVPEKMEVEDKAEEKEPADEKTSEKTEGNCAEIKKEADNNNVLENKDTKNSGDTDPSKADPLAKENCSDIDISGETVSNIAIDVLRSAFQAVGHFPDREDLGSFAEAGNPVMALAAFLAGLVGHDDAITSCRNSLKAISEVSPALQLATRHCFVLEDPPNDLKDPIVIVSPADTGTEQQKDDDKTSESTGTKKTDGNEKEKECVLSLEKGNVPSTSSNDHQELSNRKESCDEGLSTEANSSSIKDSVNPISGKSASDIRKDACNSTSPSLTPPSNTKEPSSVPSQEAAAGSTKDASDQSMLNDSKTTSMEEPVIDSSSKQKVELNKTEDAGATSTTIQEYECKQEKLENGKTKELIYNKDAAANGDKSSGVTNNYHDSISRLKRAAATTISAAAVKAKLLAEQEEDQIRRLTALLIEKQLHKIEAKLSLFTDIENVILRVREHTERTRQKLLHERSHIIAARLGLPVPPLRPNPSAVPASRAPVGYGMPGSRTASTIPAGPPAMRRS